MATEIFLQPELEEIVTNPEVKAEWEEKVMSLGLEGQLNLTRNSEKNSASPYTLLNRHMLNVFEILCPCKAAVEKYNKTQLPIEVLSHIALCKQEGYFKKMEIWYDNNSPDPVLVGYVTDAYSSSIIHLVARFGDEIIPFEVLVEKAIVRMTNIYKMHTLEALALAKTAFENAENHARQYVFGSKALHEIKIAPSLSFTSTDYCFESFGADSLPF